MEIRQEIKTFYRVKETDASSIERKKEKKVDA